jgi:hypothetical protein
MAQPEITPEDRQLYQLFTYWRNEDLSKLALIQGYAVLLLEDECGPLTSDQRQAIEVINQTCQKAVQAWYDRSYRINPLLYLEIVVETIALSEIIKEALDYLREQVPVDKIVVALPDNLPPINTSRELTRAVVILVDYIYHLHQPYFENFSATITATLHENKAIDLRIRSAQGLELTNLNSTLFESDFDLYVANFIIQKLKGEVAVFPFDKGIEFQLTVPL